MPTHAEQRVLPYTPEQLFALVADIERYPEFLPWCLGARIRERRANFIVADLLIGFRMVRERFTSKVTLNPPSRIDVAYTEGPFRYLDNHWVFEPVHDAGNGEAACRIDFFVDFEFRSRVLQKLIGVLFNEAVRRMVAAFEQRARQLYGTPMPAPEHKIPS
ncbi:MAG: type II toxin-antitoxin system RatA family toxin [Alphaproteobacteria bacterium]|nr:type II toxin-antitoxin system RatA family toxin [Alphaproteobacteria bacterium]